MTERMGPLAADHPLVGEESCYCCKLMFVAGCYVTLIPLGPGSDPGEQAKAREGRPYNAVALPVHWVCATGRIE